MMQLRMCQNLSHGLCIVYQVTLTSQVVPLEMINRLVRFFVSLEAFAFRE